MSQRRWDDVRRDYEALVFRDGVDDIARRTHVHRSTVYRIISGETRRPSGPLRAAVEDIVADATPKKGKVGE